MTSSAPTEEQMRLTPRDREILHAELRGSTAEFLGWLTGLKPPADKESIPPKIRFAFDKMVGRLADAAERIINAALSSRAAPTVATCIVCGEPAIGDCKGGTSVRHRTSAPAPSIPAQTTEGDLVERANAFSLANGGEPIVDDLVSEIMRLRSANAEMVKALEAAEAWLSGWVSAEPYLTIIRTALATYDSAKGNGASK